MSVFWKKNRVKRLIIIMFTMVMCAGTLTQEVNSKNTHSHKKTVVFDPGHGGHDKGAQGPSGTLEKSVTLSLAKMIAMELKKTYNVILTRSDDYWIDSHSRTAIANHSKADLFISIHAGGSFLHQANKTSLYYYKQFTARHLGFGDFQNRSPNEHDIQADWDYLHKKHQATSRLLAKLIQHGLDNNTTFTNSEIKAAPLMVLEGADMPAILIEIGYITNPTIEKSLRDIRVLSNIVKGVKKGINDFFESAKHSSIPE